MIFRCPYKMSTHVRMVTAAVWLLFAAISVAVWLTAESGRAALLVSLCMLLPLTIVWFFWRETPVMLEVDDRMIRIVMRSGSVREIRIASVRSVREVPRREIRWSLRMGGNGGMGGFTGLYWNRRLKYFTLYATSLRGLVLIVTMEGKKYVIGCQRAAELVELIEKRLASHG